ncbi:MAG: succinate dehydrogenase cytochrome b subunit [Ignavibacteriae bacterium]|nr:MAG: succinate dehydrogenase cytochrome b subunit [Ignavibacteriota bacterium]
MRSFGELWRTTIFQKWVMAVTGIFLVLFLAGHLAGNLLVFLGPDAINEYAVGLRELFHGAAIWVMRAGILLAFVLHIRAGIILAGRNRAATASSYSKVERRSSTVASRSMAYTGVLIAVYVLYHLAHFTWGTAHPDVYNFTDAAGHHDVYRMVVASFQQPLLTALYTIAMIVTGLHLNHAISSAFQTLGVSHPRYTRLIRMAGPMLGIVLVLGFLSVPLAIMFGMVK